MSKVFTITEGLDNLGAFRTGGQGSVYKGRRYGEIITAVKLLPTPILGETEDNKSYKDFQNEVEKLKKVNENPSPHVVKILSSGLTDSGSFPFIEMEYIEGSDIEELLKTPNHPVFTIREVIKVAEHAANALAHCHAVNVKHGDIKSNNIKYNIRSGNYVLLDFGLAIMSDEQRRTSMRQAGAIEFMAPEQYEGKVLFESDIYSYGVILYELLAGQVPFPLQDNGETARNNVRLSHLESPIPELSEIRRRNLPENWTTQEKLTEMAIPQWLVHLIKKCLEKDPAKRFSNGMLLKEYISHNSIHASTEHGQFKSAGINQVEDYEKEIAKLRNQILSLQGDNSSKTAKAGIFLPMPAVIGAVAIFLCLLIFAGVKAIDPSEQNGIKSSFIPVDAVPLANVKRVYPKIPKELFRKSYLNVDSIKRQELSKLEQLERERKEREAEAARLAARPVDQKNGLLDFLFGKRKKQKKIKN